MSKVVLKVLEPPDLRDTGVLFIEKKDDPADMFIYLPDLEKVRRVTTRMLSGSLFGSDFTYEDFQQIQGMAREGSFSAAIRFNESSLSSDCGSISM